ncbi:MAG TPA: class I SAM-dependent methyltransferase [Chloroflexota bacterium]|nr:class I SAM-dependent methyltransferase [Chloroflexota bacterium]
MQPPAPVGEDRAYLDFVLGLKHYFAGELYPRLRQQYEAHANAPLARPAADSPNPGAIVEQLPAYPLFQWLERNTQKMMWRRLEAMIRPRAAELDAQLESTPAEPLGSLTLDPNLSLPDYYAQTEFHIQPGGVWSSAANAFVYEVGAKVVMMGQNDDYRFHRLFVENAIPHQDYRAILDLGCGFGKSTRPFVDAFPRASVVGIDLSAPNLRLAHQQAERLGKRINFYQRAAEATGFPAASFDLVTATMLIHELPMSVLRRVLDQALRVLRPGGVLAVLDFAHTGDPFRDFVMDGHGARNNEPYLPHLFKTDVRRLLQEVGFADPEVLPFDERTGDVRADGTWPERAEWHFPWVVIRARKAA